MVAGMPTVREMEDRLNNPPLILVVDDDSAFRRIMDELLSRNGFQVLLARDAKEALTLIESHRPDLILTDIMMPEVDGLTLIRHLRQIPDVANIPLIVVSARVMARDRKAAADAGADGFISKPFSYTQLHAVIQNVLSSNPTYGFAKFPN
jgi:CheY-like chemotaxis protein